MADTTPRYTLHHVSQLVAPYVYANTRGPWIVRYADDMLDQVDNWLAFATEEEARAAIATM